MQKHKCQANLHQWNGQENDHFIKHVIAGTRRLQRTSVWLVILKPTTSLHRRGNTLQFTQGRKVLQLSLKSLFLRRFIHRAVCSCQIPKSIVGRRPWLSFGSVRVMATQSCFQTDVYSWKFNEENISKKVAPQKTIISHITAGKGAHKPRWQARRAGFVLQNHIS